MGKDIIEALNNINKLIEDEKYQEAKDYIKETKSKIKTKKNASSYMDDLISDLK